SARPASRADRAGEWWTVDTWSSGRHSEPAPGVSVVDPERIVPAASTPHPILGFSPAPVTRIVPPCQATAAGSTLSPAALAPPVPGAGWIHMVGGRACTRAGRLGRACAAAARAQLIRSSSVHRSLDEVAVVVIAAATASTRAYESVLAP